MDNTLLAALITAVVGFLGAAIGALAALAGAERALNGALRASEEDRHATHFAALRAAYRETRQNTELVGPITGLAVWQPLHNSALAHLIENPAEMFPDKAAQVAVSIARYNCLAEISQELFRSGQPVPKDLHTLLTQLTPDVRKVLEELAGELGKSTNPSDEAEKANRNARREQAIARYPRYLRWWARVLTPR